MQPETYAGDTRGQGLEPDRGREDGKRSPTGIGPRARARPRAMDLNRVRAALFMLIVAWAVPAGLYAVDVAWLVPPIVLLVTASLLRGGDRLADRLVLASVLLAGAACAAGLLWTVWPWRLHPVAIGGLAMTALAGVTAVTGRRPRLPRPAWTDALIAGVAGALSALYAWPYLSADGALGRLTTAMAGEDNIRHLSLFEVVGRQGYLFVDRTAAAGQIFGGMIFYPQGWHVNAAVLDAFLRGSDPLRGGLPALDHYVAWLLGTYGLLMATIIWAAIWISGERAPSSHRVIIVMSAVSLVVVSDIPVLVLRGNPGEMLALAFAVALTAIVVRPLGRTREQILLLGLLTVGIGFTYYFFLIPAAALLVLWAAADRHRRRVRSAAPVGLLAAAVILAAMPATLGVVLADQAKEFAAQTGVLPNVMAAVAMLVILVGGLAPRSPNAFPNARTYVGVLAVSVAYAVAIAAGTLALGASPHYFFGKAVHLLEAIAIIGVFAIVRLLPGGSHDRGRTDGRAKVLAATVALSVPVIAIAGAFGPNGVFLIHRGPVAKTWTGMWLGRVYELPELSKKVLSADRSYPAVPGSITVIFDREPLDSYRETLALSALQSTTADTQSAVYKLPFLEPERTRLTLERAPGKVRIVIADEVAFTRVTRVLQDEPSLRAKVAIVPLPGVRLPARHSG